MQGELLPWPTSDVEQHQVKMKIIDGLARIIDVETGYPAEDWRGRELDHGGQPESEALIADAECRRINAMRTDARPRSGNTGIYRADDADKVADNPRRGKRKTLPDDPHVIGAANYIKSTPNRPGSRIGKVREFLRAEGLKDDTASSIDKQLQRYKEALNLP